MGKLSRRDMEELREACSYDCGYTDTEEVVKDITAQVLEELDSDTTYGDEVGAGRQRQRRRIYNTG